MSENGEKSRVVTHWDRNTHYLVCWDKYIITALILHVSVTSLLCAHRYILKLAAADGGVVVSNDNYRDLINESPEFKEVVETRLLMYSFVYGGPGKPDRCVDGLKRLVFVKHL